MAQTEDLYKIVQRPLVEDTVLHIPLSVLALSWNMPDSNSTNLDSAPGSKASHANRVSSPSRSEEDESHESPYRRRSKSSPSRSRSTRSGQDEHARVSNRKGRTHQTRRRVPRRSRSDRRRGDMISRSSSKIPPAKKCPRTQKNTKIIGISHNETQCVRRCATYLPFPSQFKACLDASLFIHYP